MKGNIYIFILLFFNYTTIFANNLHRHICPTFESALTCDESCKLADNPKIFFSFKINEKNNVVLREQNNFNVDGSMIPDIPTPLVNCSVVSKKDWVCGKKNQRKIKIYVGSYIDLINSMRYSSYNKNDFNNNGGALHIMRDGRYSILNYEKKGEFECAK